MAQPGLISTAMAVSTKAKNKGKKRKRKKSTMAGGACATAVVIRFYMGDVNDQMNAYGVEKTEFDGVCPNQLCDGIGTKPSFRQLPGGAREAEIVSREPDLIPYGI